MIDPTCGSGGMLISCVQYVQDQGKEWRNISLYGQEINSLSSAIGRMNCYLHGIKDFEIVNDDTLKNPAFIKDGKLQTFDICLANPPYSISQWDRAAFETDKYGRNFLGVPPQGRADYAFIQHIIKSLNKDTGRCAILLPHGILFRNEEKTIRKNMILGDYVECVIGLAANLFYNSPMEACVLICRMSKSKDRRNKILFINAVNRVERKNAQSYLTDEHIKSIAEAYLEYKDVDGLSRVVDVNEIGCNDYSLSIPLYVRNPEQGVETEEELLSFEDLCDVWLENSLEVHRGYETLIHLMSGGTHE